MPNKALINSNHDRARTAYAALGTFADDAGLDLDNPEDYNNAVADLLTNLMHLCTRSGCVVFETALERAEAHFVSEVSEETREFQPATLPPKPIGNVMPKPLEEFPKPKHL